MTSGSYKHESAEIETEVLRRDLKTALDMLAGWCVAVDRDASWDGWDSHYKDAMYRDGPPREMLDTAIAEARERDAAEDAELAARPQGGADDDK